MNSDLITVDPETLGGTPVFKGTRVPVRSLFDQLESDGLCQIARLRLEGWTNLEIADQLGISYSTVHFHLHNIFPKFAAGNRMEAVMRWRDTNRS